MTGSNNASIEVSRPPAFVNGVLRMQKMYSHPENIRYAFDYIWFILTSAKEKVMFKPVRLVVRVVDNKPVYHGKRNVGRMFRI